MAKLIALLLAAAALVAYLRRRARPAVEHDYSLADELRSKLAESRVADEAAEPEPEPELESDLAERRREVHDRARGAIDELS